MARLGNSDQRIVNGRMWYNTEEHLLVPGQVINTHF